MIILGDYNSLQIVREASFGFYLDTNEDDTSKDILLPLKSLNDNDVHIGELVNAFIYRDSEDRLIATLKIPKAKVNELAYLKVVSNTPIGSFIDIGLERDVFVPFKEIRYPIEVGGSYLFYIYLDKTDRLAATTKIDAHLIENLEYKIGDTVSAVIYDLQTNGSLMVAVDNKTRGVVLENEFFDAYKIGNSIDLKIIKIYEDGKLGLSPRLNKEIVMSKLETTIMNYLKENDGFMTYNDKSSPEDIYAAFYQSKNYFKNALGGLMKKGLVTQDKTGTRLLIKKD
ncbi:MAG TPA: S1-like domain-containing RNA-binding protein [Clostridiaceae bacterium]